MVEKRKRCVILVIVKGGDSIVRHQPIRIMDVDRTDALGIEELVAYKGKGNDRVFVVYNSDDSPIPCPKCKCTNVKIQGSFSRTLVDVINDGETPIQIIYEFYKYRCLNQECRHIFPKPILFASETDKVTHRLERHVSELVARGFPYSRISERMNNLISKQAAGQIFNRYIKRQDEIRSLNHTPEKLGVLSGKTLNEPYVVFLDLDNDGIKVIDVLYRIEQTSISRVLQSYDMGCIKCVISDLNPTINTAIEDNLPDALHIIPVDYWLDAVLRDFEEYAHQELRWNTTPKKDEIIMEPRTDVGFRKSTVNRLLDERPQLKPAYNAVNDLREVLQNRDPDNKWTFTTLIAWEETLPEEVELIFNVSSLILEFFDEPILNHDINPDMVSDNLVFDMKRLENIIRRRVTFSEEVLKAKTIYIVETDLNNWEGVPVDEIVKALEERIEVDENYEYQRK